MSSSDSDGEFSNFNEDDCIREAKSCQKQLKDVTNKFAVLKEMLLQEKLNEIDEKINAIKSGQDDEFNNGLKQINDKEVSELEVAAVKKEFKLKSLDNTFQASEQAIRQNSKNTREIVYDTIQSRLENEIQELKDERDKADLDIKLFLDRQSRKKKKLEPKIVSGPCIVDMLKDDEILEDWIKIKNLMNPLETESSDEE